MTKRLFVGGLPYEISDSELKDIFAKIGEVASVNIIVDRMTQRPKGFGFVEYTKDEDAQKAIAELNGSDLGGRKIIVQEAKPMEERTPRRDFGRSGYSRGGYNQRDNNRRGGRSSRHGGGY